MDYKGALYNKIIIIGFGSIIDKVIRHIDSLADIYKYDYEYVEYERHPFNRAYSYIGKKNIKHTIIEDKSELKSYLRSRGTGKTLIVSASNNYLFPADLLEADYITVINFHNSLLPRYPGRNAASWEIYYNEEMTGITWHYVNAGIDSGDIIIQKSMNIPWNIRAYELIAKQMDLAGDAFEECFELVLTGTAKTIRQQIDPERHIYKAREVPGNGFFDLSYDPYEIYRILRSMDYGKIRLFPKPQTVFEGHRVYIERYKIINDEGIYDDMDNTIKIPMEEKKYLIMVFSRIETSNIP